MDEALGLDWEGLTTLFATAAAMACALSIRRGFILTRLCALLRADAAHWFLGFDVLPLAFPVEQIPKSMLLQVGFAREEWHSLQKAWADPGVIDPRETRLTAWQPASPFIACRQNELLSDRRWRQSNYVKVHGNPGDMADALYLIFPRTDQSLPSRLTFHRRPGQPRFTEGHVQFLRQAASGLAKLIELPDAHSLPDHAQDLPPRLRQTLYYLLEGMGHKEIARLMGLSAHTVREHAHRLYERFGVDNRAQLANLFLVRER